MTERRDMKQDSYVLPSVAPAPRESSMAGQASRYVALPERVAGKAAQIRLQDDKLVMEPIAG